MLVGSVDHQSQNSAMLSCLERPHFIRLGGEAVGTLAIHEVAISIRAMDFFAIFWGTLSLASGVPILLNAKKRRLMAEAADAKRLAEIAGGAEERYFEERRSLEAYPPPSSDTEMRWHGFIPIVLGLALIIMGLAK